MAYDSQDFTAYRRAFRGYDGLAKLARGVRAGNKTLIILGHYDSNGSFGNPRRGYHWGQQNAIAKIREDTFEPAFGEANQLPIRMVSHSLLQRSWISDNTGLPSGSLLSLGWNNSPDDVLPLGTTPQSSPFSRATDWEDYVPDPVTGPAPELTTTNLHLRNWNAWGLVLDGRTWGVSVGFLGLGSNFRPRDNSDNWPTALGSAWGSMFPAIRIDGNIQYLMKTGITVGINQTVNQAWLDVSPDRQNNLISCFHDGADNVLVEEDWADITRTSSAVWGYFTAHSPGGNSGLFNGPWFFYYWDYLNKDVDHGIVKFQSSATPGESIERQFEVIAGFDSEEENNNNARVRRAWHLRRIYEKLTALGDDVHFVVLWNQGLNGRTANTTRNCYGPLAADYQGNQAQAHISTSVGFMQLYDDIFATAGIPLDKVHYHGQVSAPEQTADEAAQTDLNTLGKYRRAWHDAFNGGVFDSRVSFCDLWRMFVSPEGIGVAGAGNDLKNGTVGTSTAFGYATTSDNNHLSPAGYLEVYRRWWGTLLDTANALGADNDPPEGLDVLTEAEVERLKQGYQFGQGAAGGLGGRIWAPGTWANGTFAN